MHCFFVWNETQRDPEHQKVLQPATHKPRISSLGILLDVVFEFMTVYTCSEGIDSSLPFTFLTF